MKKTKRVLWLLNHTTLRECEVPLLLDYDLEVFVPKKFPQNSDNRSASVSFDYDNTLSIPKAELEVLNQFDFYTSEFTLEIREIINKHFEICICAFMFPMFDNIARYFEGKILLRAFGLTDPESSYFDFANWITLPGFNRRIANVSERFWFAAGYSHISELEPIQFKSRALYLPLGLPKFVRDNANTWGGGKKRVLFVCPDINTYDENKQAYLKFKEYFGHLPHIICGAQTIPVDDPNVVGRLSTEDYKEVYRTSAVMFYHSEIPTHIYYHPIEAISYGMPVIYMQKSMLGVFAGKKEIGACDTFSEAVNKVEKVLADNVDFSTKVKECNKPFLRFFSEDFVKATWDDNFRPLLNTQLNRIQSSSKVAILPIDKSHKTNTTTLALHKVIETLGENGVLGHLSSINSPLMLAEAQKSGRLFHWKDMDHEQQSVAQRLSGYSKYGTIEVYNIPSDNRSDFMDCELWFIVGSKFKKPVASIKPFIMIISDNIQFSDAQELANYERVMLQDMFNRAEGVFVLNESSVMQIKQNFNLSKGKLKVINSQWVGDFGQPKRIKIDAQQIRKILGVYGCE